MATRRELLENLNAEIDRLSDAVSSGAGDVTYATDAAVDRHILMRM